MDGGIVQSGLPPDDEPWVIVDDRRLVVSRSWGMPSPGEWIGVSINALPREPITGEFRFDIALHTADPLGVPGRLLEQSMTETAIPTTRTHIFQSHLPNDAPAYYCLAVTVHGPGIHRQLNSYMTVPEQRVEARITPARDAARAGEELPFTLTNEGPTPISFGVAYRLERSVSADWVNCNIEQWFTLQGFSLSPGDQAECLAVIPRTASAGRYRVTKHVSGGGTNIERTLSFEFDVVA